MNTNAEPKTFTCLRCPNKIELTADARQRIAKTDLEPVLCRDCRQQLQGKRHHLVTDYAV